MPEIVTAVLQTKPDVIFVTSDEYAHHFKEATSTIPVVAYMWDAVKEGLAKSLSGSGTNFTGISWMNDWSLIDKWFQLIREVLPQAKKVARMACNNKYKPSWDWCHRSAQRSGLELIEARLNSPVSPEEVTRVFARLREQGANALTASGQPEIWAQSDRLIRLTEEARFPMVHHLDGTAELGALMVQSPALGPEVVRITSD